MVMRRIRSAGLLLGLGLAMTATGAATASAGPEFYKGGVPLGTKTADSFKGVTGEVVFLPVSFGVTGGCSSAKTTGTVIGPKTIRKLVVTLLGCHIKHGEITEPCKSGKLKAGEIKTNKLEGELVYLGKEHSLPIGLRGKAEVGTVLEESKCGGFSTVPTVGEWLSEVRGVNTVTSTLSFVREQNATETAPKWTQVEEAGPEVREDTVFGESLVPTWETSTETDTLKLPLEARG